MRCPDPSQCEENLSELRNCLGLTFTDQYFSLFQGLS